MPWKRKGLYRLPHGQPKGGFKHRVAEELRLLLDIPYGEAQILVRAVVKVLQDAVQKSETVEIEGLGTFWWKPEKARVYKNLQGQPDGLFFMPARKVLQFTPDPSLSEGPLL